MSAPILLSDAVLAAIGLFLAVASGLGACAGPGRLVRWIGAPLVSLGVGFALASWAFRAGWFWPLGLATPLALGIAGAGVVLAALRRLPWSRLDPAPHRLPARNWILRLSGGALGLIAGAFLLAELWALGSMARPVRPGAAPVRQAPPGPVTVALAESPAAPGARPRESAWATFDSVLDTVHRGFVRHLPAVGPISDDLAVLRRILEADPRCQAAIAEQAGWQGLAGLPAVRAVVEEADLLEDIRSASHGDLLALYRVQKDERVLALLADEQILAIVRGTTLEEISRRLDECEGAPPR